MPRSGPFFQRLLLELPSLSKTQLCVTKTKKELSKEPLPQKKCFPPLSFFLRVLFLSPNCSPLCLDCLRVILDAWSILTHSLCSGKFWEKFHHMLLICGVAPAFLSFSFIYHSTRGRILSANVPLSPDVSHLEFYPTDIPPSPDVSHPEFCPPTSHLLRMSYIRNSVRPTSHLLRIHFRPQSSAPLDFNRYEWIFL